MKFLFRADATATLGTGHIMRCLALAEALTAAGQTCHFAVAETTPAIAARLKVADLTVHPVVADQPIAELARNIAAAAVVVDGFWFDAAWREGLRRAGFPVLTFVDSLTEEPVAADWVVDVIGAGRGDEGAIWLRGPDYIFLRRELSEAARLPPLAMADRHSVLVIFGGADPTGLTVPAVTALARALGPTVLLDVVVGGSVPNRDEIAAQAMAVGAQVRVHVDPPVLSARMRRSGLAITAGGGTVGELAAFGVPALIAVIADNQTAGAAAAQAGGWAEMFDGRASDAPDRIAARAAALWADAAERSRRSSIVRAAVDGQGAERVAALLIAAAKI